MEGGITPVAKLGPAISVVEVDDDIGGVEQHDEMLREVGNRIYEQVYFAQEDRARFSHGERGADDGEIDIREILGRPDVRDVPIAANLRYRRADDFGARDFQPNWCERIARGGRIEKQSSHPLQTVLEGSQERWRRGAVE